MQNKGIFITIEGGEACGKSTQINLLKEYFSKLGIMEKVVFVREPGGTPLAEEIRNLLLNYKEDNPLPMTELLLFCASRVENVYKKILPALSEGKIVFADRFYDSTIAYQGNARNIMSPEEILSLTKTIIGDLEPDLTIYLKLSPLVAFERKKKLSTALDRIEMEGIDFHKKVAEGYEYISNLESKRFAIIDASASPQEVFQQIIEAINKKFPSLLKQKK